MMISFSLFKDRIMDGSKSHTIRATRVIPPVAGDTAFLWWKSRDPKEKELLGTTVITKVDEILLHLPHVNSVLLNGKELNQEEIQNLSASDGFDSTREFWEYFGHEVFRGHLIHWETDYVTGRKLRPEIVSHVKGVSNVVEKSKSFYPANSTEGLWFEGNWCQHCTRDSLSEKGGRSCPIILKAVTQGCSNHWIYANNTPVCLGFCSSSKLKKKIETPIPKGQLSLL